nr:unnamed protein product [Spirometra erinaceieuropaei]
MWGGSPRCGLDRTVHLRPPPSPVFLTLSGHRVQVEEEEEEEEEEERECDGTPASSSSSSPPFRSHKEGRVFRTGSRSTVNGNPDDKGILPDAAHYEE